MHTYIYRYIHPKDLQLKEPEQTADVKPIYSKKSCALSLHCLTGNILLTLLISNKNYRNKQRKKHNMQV